ncbi:MAG: lipoate--protein ligase family protein [Actinomycetota bacterium]
MRRHVRLIRGTPPGPAALDTALSQALLQRVGSGELGESFRLYRPRRIVAFGRRDRNEPGFGNAVRAARARGFEAVLRLAGGRAALFHEGTIAFAHAIPAREPKAHIKERFDESAAIMAAALRCLGIDTRIGEVPGEYCPGDHSVNARGAKKIVGIGQRLTAQAAHVGGVVVAERADLVREVLVPVYEALDLQWDPATAGSAFDESGATWADVEKALVAELTRNYEVEEGVFDEETLALAENLAPNHEPG